MTGFSSPQGGEAVWPRQLPRMPAETHSYLGRFPEDSACIPGRIRGCSRGHNGVFVRCTRALKFPGAVRHAARAMKFRYLLPLAFSFALAASGAQPKEYQVTGPVLALTDDVITVDKGGEKWEIGRSAATKVSGKLAVGSRVTVYYRMGATAVDVKDDGKGKTDAKAAKGAEAPADKAKKAKS